MKYGPSGLCLLSLFWALPGASLAAEGPAPDDPAQQAPTSSAEGAQPAPKSVAPPVLLGAAAVEYPADASGAATVDLRLTIGVDGAVAQCVVEHGEAPFAEAARSAALSWRFSPATAQGEAVASTIRFRVRFTPPEQPVQEPAGEAALDSADLPKAPRAAAAAVLEVDVFGARPEPTVRSFGQAEVRELPGAFGDPFRAIEALPGVTPIFSGVPFFYVRGAPPGNVGYFLDGVRVPVLYHAALGPSVIHPALVERVDLYPGAYPARYGRFGGGIVAGESKPPSEKWRGEANVRLFDSGALLEGPILEDQGTLLLAGRYSYTAALLSLFAENTRLEYWDYQGRASYRLGERNQASVFFFGSFDYFGESGTERDEFFSTEFHRADLRFDQDLAEGRHLRSAVTLGVDRTRTGEGELAVVNKRLSAREEYRQELGRKATLRAGADITLDSYGVNDPAEQAAISAPPDVMPPDVMPPDVMPPVDVDAGDAEASIAPTRTDVVAGAHADVVWRATETVTVTPGLRVDVYASQGAVKPAIEPRLALSARVSPKVTLHNAVGIAHQPPSFVVPVPGFEIGGLENGLQRSLQSSAGVEVSLPSGFLASATLFQNAFFNMTDLLSLVRVDSELDIDFDTKTTGHAYGLEVLLKRNVSERLDGFLAYTLSRSVRYTDLGVIPAAFDRTHVFNMASGYDLGRSWRAGGRFVFYTGSPGSGQRVFVDGRRLPAYYRLDWRLEKRWRFQHPGSYVAFIAEMLNTTLNKEAVSLDCDPSGCRVETIGPVTIPSLGVEAAF